MSERPLRVILFIISLCGICGLLLATASYALKNPQQAAREFDQSKQMLIAAKVLDHRGFFLKEGSEKKASDQEIAAYAKEAIVPLLVDDAGNTFTFEEKGVVFEDYLEKHKKEGYASLPLKLVYAIKKGKEIETYVFPVAGFGLWGPLYGYMALEKDGNHVRGISWYEHGETPGLGANITESWWQEQFLGKVVFQGENVENAPLGITVVKGKVRDVLGNQPKSRSAVDGMSGATLTGDGVTAAYKKTLEGYRRFLIRLYHGH